MSSGPSSQTKPNKKEDENLLLKGHQDISPKALGCVVDSAE